VRAGAPLVLAFVLAACGGHNTRAEQCRTGNAIGRIGRAPNAAANAVEDLRCDAIEREERGEAREREREKAQEEARASAKQAALNAELDAALAQIRRAPRVPELGAPPGEARAICEAERGHVIARGPIIECRVGGPAVFIATLNEDRVRRLDAFLEGEDLVRVRGAVEAEYGPPQRESVSSEGFRIFMWDAGIAVTMYAKGVRLTRVRFSPR
jgi:hypothetical protein